ncbi:MAG: MarR family transcriptional regulator [Vicingaceae bacterium]|jgi:DNA-binding MarR family transcriptional regulator|nr:MAG: MarR family transcriptional regulator [Vicingaceae bacterium]
MKLEDIIKQKKFRNEYQKFIIQILFSSSQLENYIAKKLKPHGITLQQYNVLRILRGVYPEPVSNNYIMERMIDRNSNSTRIVDKLVDKLLVEKKSNPKDRRGTLISILPAGMKLLEKLDPEIAELENVIQQVLSEEDCKMINNKLQILNALLFAK